MLCHIVTRNQNLHTKCVQGSPRPSERKVVFNSDIHNYHFSLPLFQTLLLKYSCTLISYGQEDNVRARLIGNCPRISRVPVGFFLQLSQHWYESLLKLVEGNANFVYSVLLYTKLKESIGGFFYFD